MTLLVIDTNLYEINGAIVDVYDINTGALTSSQNDFNALFHLPVSSIDAALNWGDGKIYFFTGDSYYRYDTAAAQCDEGYPIKISEGWKGLWAENIWACVRKNDKAYFFAGEEYMRYDCAGDVADEGYPLKIAEHWNGLPESVSGIALINGQYAIVQNNNDYYLYDWDGDAVVNNACLSVTEIIQLSAGAGSDNIPDTPVPAENNNTADWQTILTGTDADAIAACTAQIRQVRDGTPAHIKPTAGGFYYYGKSNTRPSEIVSGSVEDWIWQEIKSEGSFDSINAYDNMIVTWGKGIAKGNIIKVLKPLFNTDENIRIAFYNAGIALDSSDVLQVVNTHDGTIMTGNDALSFMKTDTKLLDFLANVSADPSFQTTIADKQWDFVMNVNKDLIAFAKANGWSADAVQLAFHLNWWLPGYGWNTYAALYKATGGDPVKIIVCFKQKQVLFKNDLIKKLKLFAGNAFAKYIAAGNFTSPLPEGNCTTFTDENTVYYVPLT